MNKSVKLVRKAAVIIVSLPIFIVGLILIPLPGPGLLLCLLALVVLSLEFDIAKKYRDKILSTLKVTIANTREKSEKAKKP